MLSLPLIKMLLNITTIRDPDSNNQAYFAYYNQKKSGDDNVSGTFLETTSSGSNVEVSAYNDGDGMANTPDNNRYTTLGEPLTLADAGIITYAWHTSSGFLPRCKSVRQRRRCTWQQLL